MNAQILCLLAAVVSMVTGHALDVEKTKFSDDAAPFDDELPNVSAKGDDGDADMSGFRVAPKDAMSFLRVRRGWVKGITGEEEEEEEASRARERSRESNERNTEAQNLARICSTSCWGPWGEYGACSAPCGNNGIQTTYRHVAPSSQCQAWVAAHGCPGSNSMTRACNRSCNNGGTPRPGSCACPTGYIGTCCETRVSCGSPGTLSNGIVSPAGSRHFYGTTVTFTCNTGYRRQGDGSRTCGADGQWSGSVPTCQVISCGDPGTPANGAKTASNGYNYGSSLTFTCNVGYNLQGDAVRRCEASGSWTGTQPTCEQIVCPALSSIANGDVSTPGGLAYNAQATYSCNSGYHLTGIATRTCQINGQWNGDAPTCAAITCSSVGTPSNGRVTLSNGQNFGSVATFSCNTGFRLSGTSSRTCQGSGPTGSWSGTQPTCQIISCSEPGTPEHGARQGTDITYGSSVTYNCLPGYALQGTSRIECQANGQWSATRPSCQACPHNTYKTGTNTESCTACPTHTHTVQTASVAVELCVCDEGYRGPNGGPCIQITCPTIALPPNAVQVSCSNVYQGNCVFGCTDGYVQTYGDDVRTCDYNSDWSGYDIVCTACGLDTYKSSADTCSACPPYSHTLDSGNNLEGCICDNGFERAGEPDIWCSDINECSNDNGQCEQTCENYDGSYTCLCTDPGFIKDAEDEHACLSKNLCPELPPPRNGGFVCIGQQQTSTERCQVKCDHGFEHVLSPNYFEECGPSTNWAWSHAIQGTPILPCEEQFFEGFTMEADVFYFVSSCDSLTEQQIQAAKEEFLAYMLGQNLCTDTGMLRCTIADVTLECGPNSSSTSRRRKRQVAQYRLQFHLTVTIPEVSRSVVDCDALCIRNSYCDKECGNNYHNEASRTLEAASDVIIEIFGEGSVQIPQPTGGTPQGGEEDGFIIGFGGIPVIPSDVVVGEIATFCETGHTPRNGTCVPCPSGSYFLSSADECAPCPLRTYQPNLAALECLPCATATEKGMDTCPPRRNPFDIIIQSAIEVVQDSENPVIEPVDPAADNA